MFDTSSVQTSHESTWETCCKDEPYGYAERNQFYLLLWIDTVKLYFPLKSSITQFTLTMLHQVGQLCLLVSARKKMPFDYVLRFYMLWS